MQTIIFDFDSTLINCESLEVILQDALKDRPADKAAFEALTRQGMEGQLGFHASLTQRLALAKPTQAMLIDFMVDGMQYVTKGMAELIQKLQAGGDAVWIISGGFYDVILPLGLKLGIPESHIHAVQARWNDNGDFAGLVKGDAFAQSKLAGAKALASTWQGKTVMVGDGMTDYALYEAGLVDDFVAYTEHVSRPSVLATAKTQASNVKALAKWLDITL
jgi:HAD superfamily phosphoserine phosphatase-like hydrolase